MATREGLTDDQLFGEYCATGSDAAFAEIDKRFRKTVTKLVESKIKDKLAAEDVIAEAFVRIVQNLKSAGKAPPLPEAFVRSCTISAIRHYEHENKADEAIQAVVDSTEQLADEFDSPPELGRRPPRSGIVGIGSVEDEEKPEYEGPKIARRPRNRPKLSRAETLRLRREAAIAHGVTVVDETTRKFVRAKEDERLLAEYRRGNKRALETLLNHYQNIIIKWAQEYVYNYEEAKRIEREVYGKVISRIGDYDRMHISKKTGKPGVLFSTWLYAITRNAAIDSKRKFMRRLKKEAATGTVGEAKTFALESYTEPIQETRLIEQETLAEAGITPEEYEYQAEMLNLPRGEQRREAEKPVLTRMSRKLPKDQEVVMKMFVDKQMTYQEIADALGIPIGTVMSRIHRARNNMERIDSGAPVRKRGRPRKTDVEPVITKDRSQGAPLVKPLPKPFRPTRSPSAAAPLTTSTRRRPPIRRRVTVETATTEITPLKPLPVSEGQPPATAEEVLSTLGVLGGAYRKREPE